MRRLAPLALLLVLSACAGVQPRPATGQGETSQAAHVSQASLARWDSFPVGKEPRPLVLLGEPVNVEQGFSDDGGKVAFTEGHIDADGKVPPEAAEAFARIAKPGTGEPRIKVISAGKGQARFSTDRGPRDLPAWIFQLTGALGPVTVLAVKPDYQAGYAMWGAKISADGLTLTVTMPAADEPCPGEERITRTPEWLESPTAVAVGLKQEAQTGNCARDMILRTAEYPIKLAKPLGNRVLVDAGGNPMAVVVTVSS